MLGSTPSYAQKINPIVKILGSDGSSEPRAVNWPHKIAPLWQKNSEGGMEFFWALQLQLPGNSGILNIQAQNSEIGINSKDSKTSPSNNQTLFLGMRSLHDEILVTLKDNTHLEIKLELIFNATVTLDKACLENNIKITSKTPLGPEQKAYMAYRCDTTSNGVNLSITVPKEIQWQANSLFESKGKGKNWKNFEISPQTISSGINEIGNFVLGFKGVEFPYQVNVEKTEIIRPISVFRLSLGMIRIALQNGDELDSTSKLGSYVLFEMRPFSPNFCFGGEGITSLPTLTKNGFFNHTESVGYLGYTIFQKKKWNLEPRVYIYLAEGVNQQMQFYYIVSTFAAGAIFNYEFNSRNSFTYESFYMKTKEQSILTSRILYTRKNPNKIGGWGLALLTQQSGMNLQNPKFGKSTQVYLGPFLEF
jgi:hypothetical protein